VIKLCEALSYCVSAFDVKFSLSLIGEHIVLCNVANYRFKTIRIYTRLQQYIVWTPKALLHVVQLVFTHLFSMDIL